MTLKQKIENLTWADLIKKLKDILGNFSTKFDNLTGRVSTLESNSGSGGGGSQDLQSVLDEGKIAKVDGGKSYVRLLEGTSNNRQVYMEVTNGLSGSSYQDSFMFMQNDYVEIQNNANRLTADLNMYEGRFIFTQMNRNFSPTRYTSLLFRDALSNSVNIYIPAPTVSGDYDIALTTDLIPTINIVPDGNFIIPNGADTKMITFTDSDPQIVTLPAIADAVGSIYFITNDSSGTLDINTKLGANDLWDGGTLVATKSVLSGTILRIINDGLSFKIL